MQTTLIFKKFIFSSISKFIASVGLIFFNILIINTSNKETLGILTVAISLITFLSIFSKFGLGNAVLRLNSIFFQDKNIKNTKKLILYVFIISSMISLFISFLIGFFEKKIALEIYNNDQFIGVLKIFAISLPIFTFIQIQKSLLRSFRLPEISNFSDTGSILFICCFIILSFNIYDKNLSVLRISEFFFISCVLIFILNFFIIYLKVSNLKNVISVKSKNFKKELFNSLPDYFSVDFVNYSVLWGSIFICSFFYEAKIIGVFSSTYWLAHSLLFFPLVLNSIYAPNFAISSILNNKKKQKLVFNQNRNLSILATLPIFFIIFIFSEYFLNSIFNIYSNEYILILRILLLNSMLRVLFGPQILFLNMSNRQKKLKFILLISAIFQISLIFISVLNFNLIILSIAFLISNFFKHVMLKIELNNYFLNKS